MSEPEAEIPDPMGAARRGARPALPKRFYQDVKVSRQGSVHTVLLDGRPVRTPAKGVLELKSGKLTEAVAAEWAAQEAEIDPARMPLTKLVFAAIDRVWREPAAVAAEIARYAASDLVLYRAIAPEGLVAAQTEHWDPIVAWAREAIGGEYVRAEGVKFVPQPDATLAAIRTEIGKFPPPFALAALASLTQLSGSALIALAVARGGISAEAGWAAAHVDEDWNIKQWGEDVEAQRRRAARFAEFAAAGRLLKLLDD